MSTLTIDDLALDKTLDQAAVQKICGGFSLGWAVARTPAAAFAPSSLYQITNNYIDYNYHVVNQNPTIFNVYNGADNSGTIANTFNTLSVNAASPALTS